MHRDAMQWVAKVITDHGLDKPGVNVLDLGGRDVNGTTRDLWSQPGRYVVVDIAPGPGVDIVADAANLFLDERFDVVTSTECLEHAEWAEAIVRAAHDHLVPGGCFIATMAGPGRAPHGQHGDPFPAEGEFYRNVEPGDLLRWLADAGFRGTDGVIDVKGTDVRCAAWRT